MVRPTVYEAAETVADLSVSDAAGALSTIDRPISVGDRTSFDR
ncbi:hypothetical protein [Halosolutus halophilus]|nr:hypothetical protein [Halosolutus halophilus]